MDTAQHDNFCEYPLSGYNLFENLPSGAIWQWQGREVKDIGLKNKLPPRHQGTKKQHFNKHFKQHFKQKLYACLVSLCLGGERKAMPPKTKLDQFTVKVRLSV